MKLVDLDARFVGRADFKNKSFRLQEYAHGAQGVLLQCPKCAAGKETFREAASRGVIGAHYVLCWFKQPIGALPVPDDWNPLGRWYYTGRTIDELTFTGPGLKSIELLAGCKWHGFIENGETRNA